VPAQRPCFKLGIMDFACLPTEAGLQASAGHLEHFLPRVWRQLPSPLSTNAVSSVTAMRWEHNENHSPFCTLSLSLL
jgi:hypothetical protein